MSPPPWVPRVLALAVVVACVTRFHQVMLPLNDSSLGLYVHVAREWLAGYAPYTRTWEFKPPGIFAIYATALALVPSVPLAIQMLGTSCAIATAFGVRAMALELDPSDGHAIGAYAALFAAMLAIEDEGYLTDAEVLIAPLITWALVLALRRPRRFVDGAAIGILLGIALQCKLSALALLPPIVALVAGDPEAGVVLGAIGTGIAVPFALDVAGYAAIGRLADLRSANTDAIAARAVGLRGGIVRENVPIFREHLRIFAPAIELAPFAVGPGFTRRAAIATFGWLACGLAVIVGMGEFYDRQFTLIYAPVALLGAFGLRRCERFVRARSGPARAIVVAAFVLAFGLHDYYETLQGARAVLGRVGIGHPSRDERVPDVARGIACLRRPGDGAYLISLTPFAYDAANVPSPTRFPFADHLFDDRMGIMIGVSPAAELRRIFATRPAIVVADDDYRTNPHYAGERVRFVEAQLARDYVPVATAPHLTFYVRRGHVVRSRCRSAGSYTPTARSPRSDEDPR